MMTTIKSTLCILSAGLIVSNCSHKPIPVDVVRKATRGIIHSVRCETRLAIKQALLKKFIEVGEDHNHKPTLNLVKKIRRGAFNYDQFKQEIANNRVHPSARNAFARYQTYGMAYDFEFDIVENNNESLNTKFRVPVPHGTFTLDIGGGRDRIRRNLRTVKASDSFEDLFEKLDERDCRRSNKGGKNWTFPIAGKIGMTEVVQSFIDINDDMLASETGPPQGIKVFSDKIVYTTKYSANATPKVTLGPVTDSFVLTEASGTFKADRKDIHQVLLAIVPPPKEKAPDKPIQVVIVNQGQGAAPRVTTSPPRSRRTRKPMRASDRAKQRARYELDRLRSEQFIQDTRDRNEQ